MIERDPGITVEVPAESCEPSVGLVAGKPVEVVAGSFRLEGHVFQLRENPEDDGLLVTVRQGSPEEWRGR